MDFCFSQTVCAFRPPSYYLLNYFSKAANCFSDALSNLILMQSLFDQNIRAAMVEVSSVNSFFFFFNTTLVYSKFVFGEFIFSSYF